MKINIQIKLMCMAKNNVYLNKNIPEGKVEKVKKNK